MTTTANLGQVDADAGALDTRTVFPVLDTIRIVGALCVLTTHAAFWSGSYNRHGMWGSVLARMDVGVALFFVLSGFLLARPWLANAALGLPSPAVGSYYLRRILRIFPVYLVTAVLALSFIHANRELGVWDWIGTLFLTDIYLNEGPPHGLTHTWSLATELSFYAFLPVLALILVGRNRRLRPHRVLLALGACAVVSVVWILKINAHLQTDTPRPLNEWLPALGYWFAMGMLLALVDVHTRASGRPAAAARPIVALGNAPGVCWLMAVGLMVIAATPVAGPTLLAVPTPGQALTKNLIYGIVGFLVVCSGVFARPDSNFTQLMSLPVLRHLGHISYAVFCIHLPVLHFIIWRTDYNLFDGRLLQVWALAVVLSVLSAELLYRCVERPMVNLGQRLTRRPPAETSTKASTTTIR